MISGSDLLINASFNHKWNGRPLKIDFFIYWLFPKKLRDKLSWFVCLPKIRFILFFMTSWNFCWIFSQKMECMTKDLLFKNFSSKFREKNFSQKNSGFNFEKTIFELIFFFSLFFLSDKKKQYQLLFLKENFEVVCDRSTFVRQIS